MTTKRRWILATIGFLLFSLAMSFVFAWIDAQPQAWWKEVASMWSCFVAFASGVAGMGIGINGAIDRALNGKG